MATAIRTHRRSAALGVAASICLTLAGCSSSGQPASGQTGDITVGLLTDLTGPAGLFGPPTRNVAQLAADEINAAGGVNGRSVKIVVGDDATNPTTGNQAARQLIQSDGAAVLVGMHSSATREAVLPIATQAKVLYLYTPVFEGGTCDANLFTNGEVPSQQLKPAIPWVQQTTGKKRWFLLGDDYVWPHKSFEMAKQYIQAAGGEVVGEEYVPLGTTDFQAVIQKVQAAAPDLMIPALVGGDAISFEKQAFDAGIGNSKIQRLGILYEDNTRGAMGPSVAAGMYATMGYFQQLDNPTNAAFLAAYKRKFGDQAPPVTSLSEETYVAIKAWAQAANAAKSTDPGAVSQQLKGLSLTGPAGKVTFAQSRFMTQPIYIAQAQPDGTTKIVQTFDAVAADEPCSA